MSWIKNLMLLLVTFVICYLLLMLGDLRLNPILNGQFLQSFKEAYAIEQQRKQDEDTIYVRQARDNGYLPYLFPNQFDFDAPSKKLANDYGVALLAGLPNSKTYYCNEGYGLVTYKSDRFGFRNDDSKWDKDVDVLFIGDSFTQGGCVDYESTLEGLFEQQTGYNTFNLGSDSNNPSHYETYAHLFIPQAHPKAVFMVFYANDRKQFFVGDRNQSHSTIHDLYVKEGKTYFFEDELKLAYPQITNDIYFKIINARKATNPPSIIKRLPGLFNYHKSLPTIRMLINSYVDKNLVGSSREALVEAKKLCGENGCELSVVYIPNSNFWRPDAFADKYADQLKAVAAELNLRFFDARKVLNCDKGSPDYAVKGFHLSPGGYKKVISLILH